jgi:hypothetical protein
MADDIALIFVSEKQKYFFEEGRTRHNQKSDLICPSGTSANRDESILVIPGWTEGPDLRCAIAHRGILGFRVSRYRAPWNDNVWHTGPR